MATRRVTVARISPRSAFLTALALSLVGVAVWLICVVLLYIGLDAAGVWEKMNNVIGGVGGERGITFGLVLSAAALMGAVSGLLCTLLAPLLAIMYNSSVDIFGGLSVLTRDEADTQHHAHKAG